MGCFFDVVRRSIPNAIHHPSSRRDITSSCDKVQNMISIIKFLILNFWNSGHLFYSDQDYWTRKWRILECQGWFESEVCSLWLKQNFKNWKKNSVCLFYLLHLISASEIGSFSRIDHHKTHFQHGFHLWQWWYNGSCEALPCVETFRIKIIVFFVSGYFQLGQSLSRGLCLGDLCDRDLHPISLPDIYLWKHYLPATSFSGGKYWHQW